MSQSMLLFLDISGGELAVIVLVIFIVLGPDKIPESAKKFGDAMRYVRSATEDIKREINVDQDLIQKPTHTYNTTKRTPSEIPKEDSTIPVNQDENTPKGEPDNKTDYL